MKPKQTLCVLSSETPKPLDPQAQNPPLCVAMSLDFDFCALENDLLSLAKSFKPHPKPPDPFPLAYHKSLR